MNDDDNYKYEIENILEIWVESDFYFIDSKEIKIANFTLTSISQRSMDIKLNFEMPEKITQSIAAPDELFVKFKKNLIFMDKNDFA